MWRQLFHALFWASGTQQIPTSPSIQSIHLGQCFGCFTAMVSVEQSQIQSVQWSLAAQGFFTSSFFDWLRYYCFTSTERCSHVVSWKYRYPASTTSPRESWDWLAGKKGHFCFEFIKIFGQQTLEILRYLRFLSDFLKRFRSDLVLMFQIGECDSWVVLREFDWFLRDLWFVIFE